LIPSAYVLYNFLTMYYIYILQCCDKSLYTGYTTDLKQRVKDHNEGRGSKYVRSRLPARLIYSEKFQTKSEAMKRENQIKDWKRDKKIRVLKLDLVNI
jgi:putative endonuclease